MTHVLVFAKQIPNVNRIEFDPSTKRIRRENVELNMNPFDKRAVEEALRIREKNGGSVSVATMGPPQAISVLKEALGMGADRGFLITDRAYAGADTLVTSRILARFAQTLNPEIILMGKYSLDGETSQVPPEVAEFLDLPFKSSVEKIEFEDGGTITVRQESEMGETTFRMPIPAVLSVSEKINRARAPSKDAADADSLITTVDEASLSTGLSGADSPTVVRDVVVVKGGRSAEMMPLNDETLSLIDGLVKSAEAGKKERDMEPYTGEFEGEAWGIALDDVPVAMEIATKLAELSPACRLKVRMIGNIDPSKLAGMPCIEYCHFNSTESAATASALAESIRSERPAMVIFPSTVAGREVSAAIAARLGIGLTADCIELEIQDGMLIQHKPAFGGGVVARIFSRSTPQMATVRPGIFLAGRSRREFTTSSMVIPENRAIETISFEPRPQAYRAMASAAVVIGIGRGAGSKEAMPELMSLADRLGAAIGGTRPVVDAGIVPKQQQIGLTGYSISPGVYIALGISGRDNHVVGIRYAGKVIAVNKDPQAPVFRHADIGIVADMFDFVRRYEQFLKGSSAAG